MLAQSFQLFTAIPISTMYVSQYASSSSLARSGVFVYVLLVLEQLCSFEAKCNATFWETVTFSVRVSFEKKNPLQKILICNANSQRWKGSFYV